MTFVPVSQKNYDGCFIACAAMLMRTDYDEAFKRLHPGRDQSMMYSHGWEDRSGQIHNVVLKLLNNLGASARLAKWKTLASFKKRNNKPAIIVIRWRHAPDLCHCIFYSHKTKKFYDPSRSGAIGPERLKRLQRQMDCGIVIDKAPPKKKVKSELPRSMSLDFGA